MVSISSFVRSSSAFVNSDLKRVQKPTLSLTTCAHERVERVLRDFKEQTSVTVWRSLCVEPELALISIFSILESPLHITRGALYSLHWNGTPESLPHLMGGMAESSMQDIVQNSMRVVVLAVDFNGCYNLRAHTVNFAFCMCTLCTTLSACWDARRSLVLLQ